MTWRDAATTFRLTLDEALAAIQAEVADTDLQAAVEAQVQTIASAVDEFLAVLPAPSPSAAATRYRLEGGTR
mgnify:FL=1